MTFNHLSLFLNLLALNCFKLTFILRAVLTNMIFISSVQIRCHASNFIKKTRTLYDQLGVKKYFFHYVSSVIVSFV